MMRHLIICLSTLTVVFCVPAFAGKSLKKKEAVAIIANLPEVQRYLEEQRRQNPAFKSFEAVEEGWEPLGDVVHNKYLPYLPR